MSPSATLSPSPLGLIGGSSIFSPRYPPAPSNDGPERPRRISHPHNDPYMRASEQMAERSQSQHRPRLEHRASQTIIDLTDDAEELLGPSRSGQTRNTFSRPPHLGRSDAENMGALIDLTLDSSEQDVIITGQRQRQLPLPHPRQAPAAGSRAESPSFFMPAHNEHRPALPSVLAAAHTRIGAMLSGGGFGRAGPGRGLGAELRAMQNMMDHHIARHEHLQVMPNIMDYQHAAFAERKPEHVAPPPARPGYTRSPVEDEVIICPSCEEELIQNKEIEEPVVKKSGRAPTKKEREEHPFWVVRECGHVYCNNCFQNRAKKGFAEQAKSTNSRKTKALACAVEDCNCDVKAKEKWVGVFL
ncbi:unnamed protein product [Diplocarpon coronariae]|uniref:Cell cycle control protein n=1 Tax=Diplocarpon coronariae TaxID=2795749 RepID=A0A218ZJ45_9HELO|nr:hypothetical protein JHW43_007613 [Diplocarpon mali]OWP07246.1 hypothetical protein B2J93_2019 [Marssonina coronariae]